MTVLAARIEGIGFWADGLPSWAAARAFAADGSVPDAPPAKPAPQLLAPNERRRAPGSVAVALEVALAACHAAGRDPATLPSVFASTHGDLSITDYMCDTLAQDPRAISPTKFHNSVHNAAAGYWTIGAGCRQAATAISAYDASFAQALLEALVQLHAGAGAVLLVGYDTGATGPLRSVHDCTGLLGGALVLARADEGDDDDGNDTRGTRIAVRLDDTDADASERADAGPLGRHAGGNAMAPMLPLFDALAAGTSRVTLAAGPGRALAIDLRHAGGPHD